MKNERYLEKAIDRLAQQSRLPWQHLGDLPIAVAVAFVHLIVDTMAEIAKENTEDLAIDVDDETLLSAMMVAHKLDITFSEFMEQALETAIEKQKALKDPEFEPQDDEDGECEGPEEPQ